MPKEKVVIDKEVFDTLQKQVKSLRNAFYRINRTIDELEISIEVGEESQK